MIFVTGAGGFIGRATLRAGNDGVRALPREGAAEALSRNRGSGRASLLHLAWPDLPASTDQAAAGLLAWPDFLARSLALRAECAKADVTFIGVGSGIETVDEERLSGPYRAYAARKAELKAALEPDAWIRPHFLFGPGEARHRFVPAAIRAALFSEPLVMGAPGRRRHWLAVDDLAAILIGFAREPVAGAWDLCGREAVSFAELIALVETAAGRPITVAEPKAPVADADLLLISPPNLAPNLPDWAGRRANLLARLAEYAELIAKVEGQRR